MPRKPLLDYSRERIGQTWTAEDHEYLATTLRKIDQTAQSAHDLERYGISLEDLLPIHRRTR